MPKLNVCIKTVGAAKRLTEIAKAHSGQIKIVPSRSPVREVDPESLINVMSLALVPCVLHYDKATQLEKWDFDFIAEEYNN